MEHSGGRIWKEHELKYVQEKWPSLMTVTEIAEHLGRTRRSVLIKASELKVFTANKPWPECHNDFVFENYPTEMDTYEICDTIKRSPWCVHAKARQLGVRRPIRKKIPRWASEFIRDNFRKMTVEELAKHTDLSVPRVKNVLRARDSHYHSVTYQEREIANIAKLKGNEKKISDLYAGQRYEDIKLRRQK